MPVDATVPAATARSFLAEVREGRAGSHLTAGLRPAAAAPASGRAQRESRAQRVDRATPPGRDRLLDGLRALSLVGVVLGHWLVDGLHVGTGAGGTRQLHAVSPLIAMPAAAPLTWLVAVLAWFLLVGGRLSDRSWTSATTKGESYGRWLRRRRVRLVRPPLVAVGVWALLVPLALWWGIGWASVVVAAKTMVAPLWFIGVYVALTMATPLLVRADRRWGWRGPLASAALVGACDLLRFTPLAHLVPGWTGWLAVAPGWAFSFQLGMRWGRGAVTRRTAAAWLAAGVGSLALLLGAGGYAVAMVGGGGSPSNVHPPTLAALALFAAACGALWLVESPLRRLFDRPRVWWATVVVNIAPLTVLTWHTVALYAPALVLARLTPLTLPGLTSTPTGPAWIAERVAWMPALTLLLAGLWWVTKRFESAPRPVDRPGVPGPPSTPA